MILAAVLLVLAPDDGELGWVRVVSAGSVSSIDGLQALPAATVVDDRLPEQTYL